MHSMGWEWVVCRNGRARTAELARLSANGLERMYLAVRG